jgi:hypothetical protein
MSAQLIIGARLIQYTLEHTHITCIAFQRAATSRNWFLSKHAICAYFFQLCKEFGGLNQSIQPSFFIPKQCREPQSQWFVELSFEWSVGTNNEQKTQGSF